MRDLVKYPKSSDLLAAWRKYPYRSTTADNGPIPPKGWGLESSWTMRRDDPAHPRQSPRLYFGNGIGGADDTPFRNKQWADEVDGVRIDHTGWYADDEGNSQWRGVVVQIPGKGGATRFLAGAIWGEPTRKDFGDGGGFIECGRGDVYGDAADAARAADSLAEYAAQDEREYREKEDAAEREAEAEAEREESENAAARLEWSDMVGGGD